MRRRPPVLLASIVALMVGFLLGASSAQLTAGNHPPLRVALLSGPTGAPLAPAIPSAAPPDPVANLEAMARKATSDAASDGADITFTLLDRKTGRLISSGDQAPFPLASVAKLFIADDLLMGLSKSKRKLSTEDRRSLDVMLRSSDDFPADDFWIRDGGNAVIARVVARYGLASTTAPYDGNWWNTMSTTKDLVRYYDMLLDGTGGLPPEQAAVIMSNLAASTPKGIDGYPQRFGIPDGLFAESVAVKQGWMCCWNGPNWLHMSTGVIGADRRYVIAMGSMQPVDDATARNTMTETIKTMFPGGRI
ncbi:hypothetical protein [Mycolicibacterium sp.]|uniref:hypothetical protein n=1 Tax=Mycolicibacterium sp. TaxID=2320850 RepID=UPI001A316116|nr:hypothetical protein [Mycolicibacterium sp.]MBJ7400966.1 hypothetical protein [Mycolicibacterium sp.]